MIKIIFGKPNLIVQDDLPSIAMFFYADKIINVNGILKCFVNDDIIYINFDEVKEINTTWL